MRLSSFFVFFVTVASTSLASANGLKADYDEYLLGLKSNDEISVESFANFLQIKSGDLRLLDYQQRKFVVRGSTSNPPTFSAISVDGRSPEGPSTNKDFPRRSIPILYGDPKHPLFGKPRLYIAYTPLLDQMEFILLKQDPTDPSNLSNEFGVIENFSKRKGSTIFVSPKVETCYACHQNLGAHFPPRPWSEFDGPIAAESNVGKHLENNFEFDKFVRESNRLLQTSKICQAFGKNGDLEKRKALLALAFLSIGRPTQLGLEQEIQIKSALVPLLERNGDIAAAYFKKFWPKDDFSVVSSVLPDRTPPNETRIGPEFLVEANPKPSPDESIALGLHTYREEGRRTLSDLDNETFYTRTFLNSDSPLLAPTVKRPTTHPVSLDSRGLLNLRDLPLFQLCFALPDYQTPEYPPKNSGPFERPVFKHRTDIPADLVMKAVMESNAFDKLLAQWPVDANALQVEVEKILLDFDQKVPELERPYYGDFNSGPENTTASSSDAELRDALKRRQNPSHGAAATDSSSADSPTVLLKNACVDCHGPTEKRALPFNNLERLSPEDRKKAVEYLLNEEMPPETFTPEGGKLSPAQRKALLKYFED